MSGRKIAILAVVIGALISGAAAAISKKGLVEIPPLSLVALRFWVAALCVLPFFIHKRGHKLPQMRVLTPISLFATLNVTFFIVGLNYTTANVGSVIYAVVPLLTAILLYIFYKEKLAQKKILAICIGFVGVAFITMLPLIEKGHPFVGTLLGNLLLALAVISWSFYMAFSKHLQRTFSPLIITSNFVFVSAIVLTPFLLWDIQNHFGWWEHVTGWGIFSVLYMAIPMTLGGYILNQYAIKHGGAILASTTFYLIPLIGFGVNFLLLGELLTPGFILGSLLALLGTYLVVKR